MKLLLAFVVIAGLLLPAYGWGQRTARPLAVKPETKQARYARLDQYAQHLPETQAATLEKLAVSLASQARTDEDKARLIFAWLAYHIAYDVAYLKGDTTHLYTPEAVFTSRQAICQGYADLFTDLATRMKLPARTIAGHGRTWSDTGNLLSIANGHAWNAYQIAGTWHLADATWGAGGVIVEESNFKQQFKPFWFDTPPTQMIFTHLPDSAVWQLLPMPVLSSVFQRWPYIDPVWFQLVSGEGMQKALSTRANYFSCFPIIKPNLHHVKLIQAPKYGELIANQPVKFVFSVPAGIEMFLVTDHSNVPLQATGHYCQATITPTEGNIWVLAQKGDDFTTSINILKYEVVPAPSFTHQLGQHRASALDSVVYLRR